MGQKLAAGLQGKMRLAMKCGVSSTSAASAPDDPGVLEKAYEAAKEICGPTIPKL